MQMAHQNPSEQAEPGELSDLFRQHSRELIATAARVTGSLQDAEDVLQTVFLRLASRPPERSPSRAYLHRAAINASIDLLRARSRAGALPLDEFENDLADGEISPERAQHDREVRRALRRALADLPGRGAEVFVLRHFEGLSHREIARITRLSRAHAAVTLFRARKRLQTELRQFQTGERS